MLYDDEGVAIVLSAASHFLETSRACGTSKVGGSAFDFLWSGHLSRTISMYLLA